MALQKCCFLFCMQKIHLFRRGRGVPLGRVYLESGLKLHPSPELTFCCESNHLLLVILVLEESKTSVLQHI